MRFLLDQDIYERTAAFLCDLGHEVIRCSQIGLQEATDEAILKAAQEQNRILVTRDRDFGALVFIKKSGAGIIYLRVTPSTLVSVHKELERVLSVYTQEKLGKSFIVVEPGGYRFRPVVIIT
ncbi:MAG: hypothetical protein C4527_24290 [Candidatus Omnitrophota bacterium]|jgi:predicted nuclease of predicted toxin-antitoxin system|nr:MAG: hypothetical protein C4527_24290 [Candidatus Omnitrophota bacterium]